MKSDYTQFVVCRWCVLLSWSLILLQAQGANPKEKAADYPVHSQLPGFEIGAEYLVHSMPAPPQGVIDVNDYLVIDVAVFPAKKSSVMVTDGEFTLRINGKKSVLFPQTPGMVAASVKYPDWEARPQFEASGGIGDSGVILGRPPARGRFPGDPTSEQSRLPPSPRVPDENPNGEARPVSEPVDVTVARAAFPEGPIKEPVSGCLFFAFRGKTKSIRSLELLYRSSDGRREATLRFF